VPARASPEGPGRPAGRPRSRRPGRVSSVGEQAFSPPVLRRVGLTSALNVYRESNHGDRPSSPPVMSRFGTARNGLPVRANGWSATGGGRDAVASLSGAPRSGAGRMSPEMPRIYRNWRIRSLRWWSVVRETALFRSGNGPSRRSRHGCRNGARRERSQIGVRSMAESHTANRFPGNDRPVAPGVSVGVAAPLAVTVAWGRRPDHMPRHAPKR
jgi:hypothetical protein